MAGGLLNLISVGNNNVILTGNPTKTFFKITYSKYTNFGLQKFRLDYDGVSDLRLTQDSVFKFKIKRYAELLMDTYIVINIPDIWSPIHEPNASTGEKWSAYDFRWIHDLGTQMIKEINITCGSLTLQKYSGNYLHAMIERDFTTDKKELFNKMSGNTKDLNDPAFYDTRSGAYPSAFFTPTATGSEPSIRGKALYIPINSWFSMDSRCAFPLIATQYNELEITVTFRPIQDLFQIRDVFDYQNNFPYVRPDFTRDEMQLFRFLQTPPSVVLDAINYPSTINGWNSDIHLISTYCFLSDEETAIFAKEDQIYLIKDIFEYSFTNIIGTQLLDVKSTGMVSSWMWFLQRNDVYMRNEWSNYSNWPYRNIPIEINFAPLELSSEYNYLYNNKDNIGPLTNPDGLSTGFFITGDLNSANRREILETFAIKMNGEYRENSMLRGVFDYVEKYTRTKGNAKEGLYCYNFCLNSDPKKYQPSGAINMNKFSRIELEITTYVPQLDLVNSIFNVICDQQGNPIGVSKQNSQLYEYNYNLFLMEERYNILSFIGGTCGLLYAR
jgi:hypothetical protein